MGIATGLGVFPFEEIYMKKWIQVFLISFLALSLAACSCGPSTNGPTPGQNTEAVPDAEFTQFLDDYLVDYCELSYLSVHQYFLHPENYGIDLSKCPITLGSPFPESKRIELNDKTYDQLKKWNTSALSKKNRWMYEQLLWECERFEKTSDEKFDYIGTPWSMVNGMPSSMVTLFSEYSLYTKDDLEPLEKLINDMPRYVEENLEYTRKQAEQDLFSISYDSTMKTIDDVLKTKDDSPVTESLEEEIDGLTDLNDAEKKEWKTRIKKALDTSFFPSYETMKKGLEELKDKNKPLSGMASLPNGKEAYEEILKMYTGMDMSPVEINKQVTEAVQNCLTEYSRIINEKEDAASLMSEPETTFSSISEIIPFLNERYPAVFPLVDEMDYEVKPLAPEQSQDGVLAYFLVPPIDSTDTYEIRYNECDYGSNPQSLSLYDTFAHEGIPGHMYQTQYLKEHAAHPLEYILGTLGTQEGYATYAALQTLPWTGIDEDKLEVWELSELFSNYTVLLMDYQVNYENISREEFAKNWGEGTDSIYDRLCLDPGVFYAYYFDCMKLLELNDIAKESLGEDYDPVEFHTALLNAGNMNFSIIEESVQDYIDSVRMGTSDSELPSTVVNDPNAKSSTSRKPKDDNKASGSMQMKPAD